MSDAQPMRDQAMRWRELAEWATDPRTARVLREMAEDYEARAAEASR